ncbi:MAG: ferrous iron transporter B, partial [Bacteroidia bacterium]|nr:ferrous iron transporter B [Bacteroidia bacterium]
MKSTDPHIALIGNPNCGKSTLFNRLTGLRQSTSNLPGTTVEQKSGIWKSANGTYKLTDLPGIYSLFTDSDEEGIVVDTLLGKNKEKPNLLVFLLDASNLRRNLLLFTQVAEIGIPIIVGLTMSDTAARRGIGIDSEELSKSLGVPVILINPRKGSGIQELEAEIQNAKSIEGNGAFEDKLQRFRNGEKLRGIGEETLSRYVKIEQILKISIRKKEGVYASATRKLDRIFTHPIMGYLAFAAIMLTIFQGVFTLAEYPMGWIENGFGHLATFIGNNLDDGFLRRIITGGILPGLSGVLVFLPQIAILFFFISVLEDSGYMVRASFITD